MVLEVLPPRLIETGAPLTVGVGNPARGSDTAAAPVTGATLKEALAEPVSPPTIWMEEAVTVALPLTLTADVDIESTTMMPGTLRDAFPETFRAPAAEEFRT